MFASAMLRRRARRFPLAGLTLAALIFAVALPSFASGGDGHTNPVRATGNIVGRVADAQDHPIAGAEVEAEGQSIAASAKSEDSFSTHAKTAADGSYAFRGIPVGAWLVRASADHFLPAHKNIILTSGTTVEVDLTLTTATAPTGRIVGVVRDSVTSAPLAGARVYYGPLFDDDLAPGWWEDANDSAPQLNHSGDVTSPTAHLAFVLTGPDGAYEIPALRAGDYYLLAKADGHDSERRKVEVLAGEPTRADFRLDPIVILPPGQIEGHVLDADTSAPLAGARIFYSRLIDDSPRDLDDQIHIENDPIATAAASAVPPSVVTDNTGHYLIPDLHPGYYHLLARADGHRPQARRAQVLSSRTTTVNFALTSQTLHIGSIVGKVIDAVTTAPLEGVRVIALPSDDVAISGFLPAVQFGSALTGPDGLYRIDHVPAGPVRVYAFKDGYRAARQGVRVPAGGEVRANFELQPAPLLGALAGTVLTSGTLEPIANALVEIEAVDNETSETSHHGEHSRVAVTDANGQYGFRDLPAGDYKVKAAKHGFKPARIAATIVSGAVTRGDFLLVQIPRPPFGGLAGVVIDAETSQPLAGAIVHAQGDPQTELTDYGRRTARTNDQGEYELKNLPAGDYVVSAFKRGYKPERQQATVAADFTKRLDFALAPIHDTGSIEGLVTDALTSEPLANARVFVPLCESSLSADDDTAVTTLTDNLGHYRLNGVPVGLRTVVARARGHFLDAQLATVSTTQTATVDFQLVPWPAGQSQHLKIRAIDGILHRPLAHARIHLAIDAWTQPLSNWDEQGGETDANGEIDIDDVPPGDWTLAAAADGFAPQSVSTDATIQPAPSPSLAAASGAITGTITLTFQLQDAPNAAADWRLYP